MRLFILEPVFWDSAVHALLGRMGVTGAIPYRVLVRAERVWLRDAVTSERALFGLYATKFVVASSEAGARAAALEAVRADVLAVAGDPKDDIVFEIEKADARSGIVWRQARGFSLFPLAETTSGETRPGPSARQI